MSAITAEMTIADIMHKKPEAAQILMSHGMHCLGCAISSAESLSDAAQVHGIDLNALLKELNQ